VIRYRFTTEPMRAEDRFINPLGFEVTRYRRDQEAVTPPEPAAVATPAATQPQVSAPELKAKPAPTRPVVEEPM
jgi:type IV secretion system protein VirB8